MKLKKLLKAIWSQYQNSQDYKELSLDQQNRPYTSIEDVCLKIFRKETKKFEIKEKDGKIKIKSL